MTERSWASDQQTAEVGGVGVLVRGWLHGNVVRIGRDLVDTGYHTGVDGLRSWLRGPVERIVLTHVHSDHAGGVAALQDGAEVFAHRDARAIVDPWDPVRLWLDGQALPHFRIDRTLCTEVEIGGRRFDVVETPGHATGGVSLVDADGLMITGDALWASGFGILNPAVDGPEVFDLAALALDRIEEVGPRVVIPGHGPPFVDVGDALARARQHLERMRDPVEHQRRLRMSSLGFWALMHPEIGRGGLRERVLADGGRLDEPWVEPLIAKLRP